MTKRILIVDDDLYLRELYQEVLASEGYEVDLGTNGEEGLAKLQQGEYDLVFLDVIMPKLDGIGVLESLSKNPPLKPNGPIILLTNLKDDPLLQDVKSKGAGGYLIKADLNPQDFLNHAKKLLDN